MNFTITSKAIAFAVIPLIVASAVIGLYFASQNPTGSANSTNLNTNISTLTNTSTTIVEGNQVTNSSVNGGLKLFAAMNLITGESIGKLNVTFLVENTLPQVNNVSKESNWAIPAFENKTATMFQCIGWGNALIFRGYYTAENISGAVNSSLMPLFQPGVFDNCSYYEFSHYSFQPASANATVYGQQGSPNDYGTRQIIASSMVAGYYTANQSYARLNKLVSPLPFPVGSYTIAVGDEWGQLAFLHFDVVLQQSEVSTTSLGQSVSTTPISSSGPNSSHYDEITVTSETPILTSNPAFDYDRIPYSLRVGNFSIRMVNNGTGYTIPPINGTSRMYTGYAFAFNVTSPDNATTNVVFEWTPPCSTNLGLPCQVNNKTVLPNPENVTVNYELASLLILWYKNTTGLYVSFQEWDEVQVTTITTLSFISSSIQGSSSAEGIVSSSSTCVYTLITETVMQEQYFTNNGSTTTLSTYTTTYNPCG
ncbi:MAG TPA: hypothetical protein VFF30_11885 [Nitrososphaerales archaeon]|nr:hypothetical protein [Nitrososphaerales archaeon]